MVASYLLCVNPLERASATNYSNRSARVHKIQFDGFMSLKNLNHKIILANLN